MKEKENSIQQARRFRRYAQICSAVMGGFALVGLSVLVVLMGR